MLIKGGNYLETPAKVDVMVFDKTGTLTANRPAVIRVLPRMSGVDQNELLRLAAAADRRSAHPLAKAVVAAAAAKGIEVREPDTFDQLQGRGVKAGVGGRVVLVGNAALMRESGVVLAVAVEDDARTALHVAIDGQFAGVILVADTLRPRAKEALAELKASGVKRFVMLTGDSAATAKAVASEQLI